MSSPPHRRGPLKADALVKAHIFARLSPVEQKDVFAPRVAVPVSAPGDLEPIPLSELHVDTGLFIQREMLGDLRNAAHAYCQHSDQHANIRPPSRPRPILDDGPSAAELKSESAGISNLSLSHARDARTLSFDEDDASSGGLTKRARKLS